MLSVTAIGGTPPARPAPPRRAAAAHAVDELAAYDVAFYVERRIIVPGRDKFEPLDAAAARAWVTAQPAQFAAPLLLAIKGFPLVPVRNTDGLCAAAALHAGGDVASLELPALGQTLRTAIHHGVEFVRHSDRVPAFIAYEALREGTGPVLWNSDGASQYLYNPDEALAHAFFSGQGPADALRDPRLAQGLARLRDAGVELLTHHRNAGVYTTFEAYRMLGFPRPVEVNVGVAGVPICRLVPDRIDAAAAELAPYQQAYRDVMQPAGWYEKTCQDGIERLRSSTDKVAQARFMVALHAAAAKCGAHADYELRDKTFALYDWQQQRTPTAGRTADLLRWVGRAGTDQAQLAADTAWRLEPAAEASYGRLFMLCGRAATTSEALAALPPPLPASTESYAALYEALQTHGDEKQTLACFKMLAQRPTPLDETVRCFLEGYVKTGSVDGATRLLDAGPPGTVERHDGAVVIGGVRVPIRNADGRSFNSAAGADREKTLQ